MKRRVFIIVSILALGSISLFAQAPPPPPGNAGLGGGPVGSGPASVPIDGGITLLLSFAGLYALSRTRIVQNETRD